MELQKEFPMPKQMVEIPALGMKLFLTGHNMRRVHFHSDPSTPVVVNTVKYNLRLFVGEVESFDRDSQPWQERPHNFGDDKWSWAVEMGDRLERADNYEQGTDAARKKVCRALSEWTSKFMQSDDGQAFLALTCGYLLEKELNRAACALEALDEAVAEARIAKGLALDAYLEFATLLGVEV